DNETRITAWNNIGDCYLSLNNPREALRSYRKSDSLCSILNAPFYHFYTLAGMGKSYLLLGNERKAAECYARAEEIARKKSNRDQLKTLYHEMSEMYEKQGNLSAALASYKMYERLKDSVSGEEVKKNISELEVRYKTAQKEREILQKTIEIQRQREEANVRNLLLGGSGLLVAALLFILAQRHHLNKQKLRAMFAEQELSAQRAREEERLRIASDMHDELGAGLTAIKVLADNARHIESRAATTELEKITAYAGELVSKLSEIVWAMKNQNDSLENLLAYIRAYAAGFLSDANIACRFDIPEVIPSVTVPGHVRRAVFLVVKEALNNVVKHARASEVGMSFGILSDRATITIQDNGVGLSAGRHEKKGTGLDTMRQRVTALGGTLHIEAGNGTILRFTFLLSQAQAPFSL
ncbi:MAG TPA: ATP-binding protein, partial [Bacteroidota bacterium]|nr:ATP-binding protein [Bacteroidota bacterium]